MSCKYCNATIRLRPAQIQLENDKKLTVTSCFSKKCLSQFAFESYKDLLEIYDKNIRTFLFDLAKAASSIPDRFDPLPVGFSSGEHLDKLSNQFMNYLQMSLGNVKLIEDDFFIDEKKGFKSYTFDYSNDPWQDFTYLFHGSPFHNWHSIVRNGLKNYSGTNKMTTGAVYGPGIYFSDDLSVSFGYVGGSYSGKYAIGVFEVKKPSAPQVTGMEQYIPKYKITLSDTAATFDDPVRQYYRRSQNIFVVPYEENVRLKYLIIIPSMGDLQSFSSILIKSFIDRLNTRQTAQVRMNALSLKRLSREKKLTQELIPDLEIKDNNNGWTCKYKGIDFDVILPPTYPMLAPDIVIQNFGPHPQIYDGHVCMDILYNWQLNYKLEYVLLTFIHEILNEPSIYSNMIVQEEKKPIIHQKVSDDEMLSKFFNEKIKIMETYQPSIETVPINNSQLPVVTDNSWVSIKNSLEMLKYLGH